MVNAVVVDPDQWQTVECEYNPALCGEVRVPVDAMPSLEFGLRKFIARRAALELRPGAVVNLGIGVTDGIANVAAEEGIIDDFVKSAKRAQLAGADGVELHATHGYLIQQFLSAHTNLRTDEYGGSPENKARFACEVIGSIKKKCGADFPVIIKINAMDFVEAEEQITPDLAYAIAPYLEKAGADEIHVSGGQHESPFPAGVSPYYKAPLAKLERALGALLHVEDACLELA